MSSENLFELTGGHLCLDLANTLDRRRTDHPREMLATYEDLLQWATQAGVVTPVEAGALHRRAARNPRAASGALGRTRRAREAIFRIFSAVAGSQVVAGRDLQLLDEMLATAATKRRLTFRTVRPERAGASRGEPRRREARTLRPGSGRARGNQAEPGKRRFEWTWPGGRLDDLDRVMWPAVWSAADVLTGEDVDRVRQCAGAGCAWLFIDRSRNHTRRWCDMSVCGNRAKARRHYAHVKRRNQ